MILVDLISEFKEASGRIDLDDPTIIRHLNRGSRLLDRRSHREKIESRAHTALEAGTYIMTLDPDLRAIKSVWAMTESKRWQIAEVDLVSMRFRYQNSPVDVAPGTVIEYCQTSVTLGPGGPTDRTNPSGDFLSQWAGDLLFNNADGYRGLVLFPLPDTRTIIEVIGNYYTPALSTAEGQEKNWWSQNHESLLIQAALITLDINYRNTSGAKDLYASIDAELQEIFYDDIEEGLYQASAMGGSTYGLSRTGRTDVLSQTGQGGARSDTW